MSSASPPINSLGTPMEKGSAVETYPIKPSTLKPFFPAVCLSTHWDPTRIYARTVPTAHVNLPLDFRPYTKVCLDYRTSAPEQAAPDVSDEVVFPNGGDLYPPTRYINNIDRESLLRRLDRPLGTCDPAQYYPPFSGDMYKDGMLVPPSAKNTSKFITELSLPQALLRDGNYHCRSEADQKNWDRSTRLFNNPTKQDRYTAPSSVEKPRQNIWNTQLGCQNTPLGGNSTQAGNRAWGAGQIDAQSCQLR